MKKVALAAVAASMLGSASYAEQTCVVGVVVPDEPRPISFLMDQDGLAKLACDEARDIALRLNTWPQNGNDVPGAAQAKAFRVVN